MIEVVLECVMNVFIDSEKCVEIHRYTIPSSSSMVLMIDSTLENPNKQSDFDLHFRDSNFLILKVRVYTYLDCKNVL